MAYTTIDDPSAFFQSLLYTGSGSPQDVTNEGNSDLQPDFVWTYLYNSSNGAPNISDSSRGVGSSSGKYLRTDSNTAEADDANGIRAFNTDGFKTGDGWFNGANGYKYIAWQLKANGGTTTSVSSSGTGSGCVNACTHQANTTAGFSIITYTGRDDQLNNGQHSLLKHGLGVTPTFTMTKRRDSTGDWYVMGKELTSSSAYSNNEYLSLNDTDALNGNSYVGSVAPTSTDIYLGNELVNIASATYVMYAFAEKQGYSKFGKYTGNSNSGGNGPFVYTGFTPAFVLIKRLDSTNDWIIHDYKLGTKNATGSSKGNIFNVNSAALRANELGSQLDDWGDIDMYSNGFKPRSAAASINASGTYIYMAFAHAPFVSSTGIPTTAR